MQASGVRLILEEARWGRCSLEPVLRLLSVVACVLGVAGPVYAAELHWDVPEGCPDVQALERESEQVLGEPLAKYPLKVAGTVTHGDAKFSLSLRMTLPAHDETRERELEAGSCQELLEAAAVAIALAAADSGALAVAQSTDSELRPRPPTPVVLPVPPERSHFAVGAAGTSSLAVLPSLGFGAEVQLQWVMRWFRVGAAASWFPLRSMPLTEASPASFGVYLAELFVCGQLPRRALKLFLCNTGQLGRMNARLDMPASARTPSASWRALGVRFGGSYTVAPPLEVTASLSLLIPLTRPRFYARPDDFDPAHQPGLVAAQVAIGLLFSL
jgi:hypothetical protein